MIRFLLCVFLLVLVGPALAQDTLPRFLVRNLGNDREGNPRIVISWVNPYDSLRQLSIQTSHDSLKNYRTLITLTDPNARMNGFADTRALNDHMFYRLFIVRANGQYFFSGVQKPVFDTLKTSGVFKESVEVKKPEVPVVKKPDFVPSFYVYTNKEGYVYLNLPDAEKQKYRVKFYEENEDFLFELKTIRQPGLTLDKANFLHAGWYFFELFNDVKLIEKHRFYLAKEF